MDLVFFGGSELAFRDRFYGSGPELSDIFAGRLLSETAAQKKTRSYGEISASALTPTPFAPVKERSNCILALVRRRVCPPIPLALN
jgi:hypothetical protein